jgi:hypothetical protein
LGPSTSVFAISLRHGFGKPSPALLSTVMYLHYEKDKYDYALGMYLKVDRTPDPSQ